MFACKQKIDLDGFNGKRLDARYDVNDMEEQLML